MAQNITLLGASYTAVPAVTLPKTGGGTARFDDCTVVTAVASDVSQGKVFVASDGTVTTGTGSGGGGTDFIVTLSYDSQSAMWIPDKTYAELYSAYSGGKTIAWMCDDGNTAAGDFSASDNSFSYTVYAFFEDGTGEEGFEYLLYTFDANGVTFDGSDGKNYYTGDATATAADVANGKVFYNANGRAVGTASGGGGASNIVTGTFTGTTTGAAMDVTLNYSGSGYPVAVMVYPSEGTYNNTTTPHPYYNLVQRYAIDSFIATKSNALTAPTYTDTTSTNYAEVYRIHKANATSNTTLTGGTAIGSSHVKVFTKDGATSTNNNVVKINSSTKMSVFIASNSYGFAVNIPYTYHVIYSS